MSSTEQEPWSEDGYGLKKSGGRVSRGEGETSSLVPSSLFRGAWNNLAGFGRVAVRGVSWGPSLGLQTEAAVSERLNLRAGVCSMPREGTRALCFRR